MTGMSMCYSSCTKTNQTRVTGDSHLYGPQNYKLWQRLIIFYIQRFFQLTGTYNSSESVNVLRHMKFTLISKNYERAMSITWRVVY